PRTGCSAPSATAKRHWPKRSPRHRSSALPRNWSARRLCAGSVTHAQEKPPAYERRSQPVISHPCEGSTHDMDSTAVRTPRAASLLLSPGLGLRLLRAVLQGASSALLLEPLDVVDRLLEVLLDRRGQRSALAREALVLELRLGDRVVVGNLARVGEDLAIR